MSELRKFVVTRHREISIIYGTVVVEARSSNEAYDMALDIPLNELTPQVASSPLLKWAHSTSIETKLGRSRTGVAPAWPSWPLALEPQQNSAVVVTPQV